MKFAQLRESLRSSWWAACACDSIRFDSHGVNTSAMASEISMPMLALIGMGAM